jgi:hypothetical protein
VLRHETGETLGYHHYSLVGHLEEGRLFPLLPGGDPATTTAQAASVFQAATVGVDASYGLFRSFDLQLGTSLATGGAGWRIGGKYLIFGNPQRDGGGPGNFALSAQLGYGVSAGTGTITYTVPGNSTEDVSETLSTKTIDIAFPISYRFTQMFAGYSGLLFFHNSVSGAAANAAVSQSFTDLGVNLGVRATQGIWTGDAELALLKVSDVSSGSRIVPYFGVAFGVIY